MDQDEVYGAAGVCVLVLAIILLICVMSYCHRRQPVDQSDDEEASRSAPLEQGLNEATISGYPKLLYSEAKRHKFDSVSCSSHCCCSICLADFEDEDVLRSVPDCGHFFHQICVDKWLQLHRTCPVCRNSLVDPSTSLGSVAEA